MQIVHQYADGSGLGAILSIFFDRAAGGNMDNDFVASLDWANATPEGTDLSDVNLN